MAITTEALFQTGRATLLLEMAAIKQLSDSLNDSFIDAVFLLINRKGKIVFSGVGKSGHIARKIAATFTSTGMPSVYIHPSEGAHGDLGLIEKDDIVVAISNSGETEELLNILPTILEIGAPILSLTSNDSSSLAKHSTVVLVTPDIEEASPLKLAPTTSTTVTLALGDALACACMKANGLTKEQFAFSHPAGRLGRRLAMRVSHVMKSGSSAPIVNLTVPAVVALERLVEHHLGCVVAVDNSGRAVGIFTEGDLCRLLKSEKSLANLTLSDICTPSPKTVNQELLAYDALQLLQKYQINQLIVTDADGQAVGVVHMQHLINSRL